MVQYKYVLPEHYNFFYLSTMCCSLARIDPSVLGEHNLIISRRPGDSTIYQTDRGDNGEYLLPYMMTEVL